jgi:hypothetical protein
MIEKDTPKFCQKLKSRRSCGVIPNSAKRFSSFIRVEEEEATSESGPSEVCCSRPPRRKRQDMLTNTGTVEMGKVMSSKHGHLVMETEY